MSTSGTKSAVSAGSVPHELATVRLTEGGALMPRVVKPWFRVYSAALNNQKLQRLKPDHAWFWFNLMCLANESESRGSLPALDVIAFSQRLPERKAQHLLHRLVAVQLVDEKDGVYTMHDWDDWQRHSDVRATDGRETADEARDYVGGKWVNPPTYGGDSAAVARHYGGGSADEAPPYRGGSAATEREERREEEKKSREEKEDARPPEHPFAFLYAQKYAERNPGRRVPPAEHASALALEREYGAQPCIDVATDYEWQKHPNYLKPVLEERKNGRAKEPVSNQGPRRNTRGGPPQLSDGTDVDRYLANVD